jgi:hypothetical protein
MAVIAAKQRQEVLESFRQRGALSPATAKTRAELGLERNPAFGLAARGGALVEVGGGRFYLDQQAAARQESRQQSLILWLLAGLMVFLAILLLVG